MAGQTELHTILIDGWEVELQLINDPDGMWIDGMAYEAQAQGHRARAQLPEAAVKLAFQRMAVQEYAWNARMCAICQRSTRGDIECNLSDCDQHVRDILIGAGAVSR